MNYLIYINSKSEPVLVSVPKKPICLRGISPNLCVVVSRSYNQKCDCTEYQKEFESALSDESKHIRFKDPYHAISFIVGTSSPLHRTNWLSTHISQTFPLPEGIFVRVEEQNCGCYYLKGPSPECIEAGGKNPYKCVRGAIKVALVYKQKSKYVQEPKVEEQAEQPYFTVNRNDYGKGFLYYMPSEEAGKFKCWMPLDDDLYVAIEKMIKKSSGIMAEEQLKEKQETAEELLKDIYLSPEISFGLWSRVQAWYQRYKKSHK